MRQVHPTPEDRKQNPWARRKSPVRGRLKRQVKPDQVKPDQVKSDQVKLGVDRM